MAVRLLRIGVNIGLSLGLAVGAGSFATPAEAATASAPAGSVGYDVSYPQCPNGAPSGATFSIVGVTDGTAFSTNKCLAQQFSSTSSSGIATALYVNTGNPGPPKTPGLSSHWPAAGTESPAKCIETADANDPGCAYDYGWAAGQVAAQSTGIDPTGRTWWLDVEQQNSWDGSAVANAADLQGEMDALRSAGAQQVGIYSTSLQWNKITGGYTTATRSQYEAAWSAYFTPIDPLAGAPLWIPTGSFDVYKAYQACSSSFTGARTALAQYLANVTATTVLDADLVCGGASPVSVAGAPGKPAAHPGSKRGTLSLTWTAPTATGGEPITGYLIYRGTSGGHLSAYRTVSCTAASCSWTDSSAKHGRRYYYKVAAVNEVGTGHQSAWATAKGK